jgi:hypothetical protein
MRTLSCFLTAACLAAVALTGCAPQAAPTNTAQPVAAITLEATRALVVAELAYKGAATTALAATRAGLIHGADAERLRQINADATRALIQAKTARDAGARLAATVQLLDQVARLEAVLRAEGIAR